MLMCEASRGWHQGFNREDGMKSALNKAMNGEKVPETQQKGALSEAVDKLKSLGGRISKVKEQSEAVADAVIATAEIQGAVFGASFAEGYFGEEKMDVGPIDLRLAGGVVLGGYGMYQTMSGKGGEHSLALGNGLVAVGVARVGRNAGKALAEKKDQKSDPAQVPQPTVQAANPNLPQLPAAQGDFGELVRDIFLTPKAEDEALEGASERHRPRRFIRANAA